MSVFPQQIEQFHKQGFCVIENAIPTHHLLNLCSECERYLDKVATQGNSNYKRVSHFGERARCIIEKQSARNQKLSNFIFSDAMAEITKALLGPTVYLYHEQYSVVGPQSRDPSRSSRGYPWIQDSSYLTYNSSGRAHKPYLTCWIALDDITVENAPLYILPWDQTGIRDVLKPWHDDFRLSRYSNSCGVPVEASAGTIIAYSSLVPHRVGENKTDEPRQVYEVEYASEQIEPTSTYRWSKPFVRDGVNIRGAK